MTNLSCTEKVVFFLFCFSHQGGSADLHPLYLMSAIGKDEEFWVGTYWPEAPSVSIAFNKYPNGFYNTHIFTFYLCAFENHRFQHSPGVRYGNNANAQKKSFICHTSRHTHKLVFIIKNVWWEGVHVTHRSTWHTHVFCFFFGKLCVIWCKHQMKKISWKTE